ncbi:hypothetical protein CHELA40_30258 [Chelatococcus asaccharovorans]|nr:hypothetical protein CHELA17_40157 [Chelatococcus asaccharovorans]CAH1688582.1 hypothetical protein CHELA40_30258 [Chelatococcus asaccharovorans]
MASDATRLLYIKRNISLLYHKYF